VKRSLVLVALSSTVGLLIFSSGAAQSQAINRGFTERVTNTTTPKRDRLRPYTFTTKGRIVVPTRYCAPGVDPVRGAGNCIPIVCPPGTTNLLYCKIPTRAEICAGKVNVKVTKRNTAVSSRTVKVRSDCTYRSRVSFRLRLSTRVGTLRFRPRFLGNQVLQPRKGPSRTARAG